MSRVILNFKMPTEEGTGRPTLHLLATSIILQQHQSLLVKHTCGMHFCLYSCFVIARDVERKETTLQSDTNITLRNNKLQLLIKSSLFYNRSHHAIGLTFFHPKFQHHRIKVSKSTHNFVIEPFQLHFKFVFWRILRQPSILWKSSEKVHTR